MWRHIASNAVTFLIVGLFLLGGVILWGKTQYDAAGPLTQAICLQVERGSNMRRVSSDLADQGAVTSCGDLSHGADYSDKNERAEGGQLSGAAGGVDAEIVDIVTRGGASTCGTEVVYRIGVNRAGRTGARTGPGDQPFCRAGRVHAGRGRDARDLHRKASSRPIRGIASRWPRA